MDDQTRVWASSDEGTSWAELTANLPRLTTPTVGQAIAIYSTPSAPNAVLMAGGLTGVFEMPNPSKPGARWSMLGDGLPHALVLDLHYDYTHNVLVAGTLGRGAWMLSNPFGDPGSTAGTGGGASPAASIPAGGLATLTQAPGALDAFFAALAGAPTGGTGSAGAAGDLLAVAAALLSPSPAPPALPASAGMTPAAAAVPPSLSGSTGPAVPPPARVSGTPTAALARRAADGPADGWGTDVLTSAGPSWDGEAATWPAP
jgi:hypothetical protein